MKITNIENGPRGLNTKDGPVLVEPGQTVDVELSKEEAEVARKTGWFDMGKGAKAAKESEDSKKDDGADTKKEEGAAKTDTTTTSDTNKTSWKG